MLSQGVRSPGLRASGSRNGSCSVMVRAVPPFKAAGAVETDRRSALVLGGVLALGAAQQLAAAGPAAAIDGNPFKKDLTKRRRKIPESEYTDGPQGLKYYDLVAGTGAEPTVGQRVAIHFDVKYRGVTLQTSRVGMGVTGGNPVGFDVGLEPGMPGSIGLKAIDLGVRNMRVGGVRRMIVPPELGYGNRQAGELPPNSTIEVDIELLSIKASRVF
ncbi:MAG: hypothetical protein J3K34DRAFT_398719 [Monoraphidium minutum]|nr:MAG: hypothetical protein J3K34DRAFT_398719 [Monoraphidium minutum]